MKNILEKYKIILLVLLSLCHLDFTLRLTFSSIKKKLTIDKSNSIQIRTELIIKKILLSRELEPFLKRGNNIDI